MENKIIVSIPKEISDQVKEKFYSYKASNQFLQELLKNENLSMEILDKYYSKNEKNNVELELLKEEVSNKYVPHDYEKYEYVFDFINSTIIYTKIS